MVFSSNIFLFVFLPAVLLLYYAAPRRGLRLAVLTVASYAFYAWADPRFILLLWWTTALDFACGNLIGGHWRLLPGDADRPPRLWFKRTILALSLTNALGLLAFFKYAVFAQETANALRESFGAAAVPVLAVVLPAGISFYTFESISYVIDVYRGEAAPAPVRFAAEATAAGGGRSSSRSWWSRRAADGRGLLAFACYLAQFPHLVAGPIIRYQELESHLHRPDTSVDRFARGVILLSLGLGKKVLLANTVARAADAGFDGTELGWADAWWATLAYAFQIYFDFSGYSDMAVGLALMLGFDFPRNFDAPYRAQSVTDFWRRWHITLSRWLRDYLYIPLGGNRRGEARTYVNLILTMALGGLWHGASWTFVAWGLFHGTWLAVERAAGWRPAASGGAAAVLRTAGTFAGVCVGWVIFRSDTVWLALDRIVRLVVPAREALPPHVRDALYDPQVVAAMLACATLAFGGVQAWDVGRRVTWPRALLAAAVFVASAVVLSVNASNPFLYFRF